MAGSSAIVFVTDDTARTGLDRPLMLTPVAGSSLLSWLCGALRRAGVHRLLLVCRPPWTEEALACCPDSMEVTAAAAEEAADSLHVFLTTADTVVDITTVITGPVIFDRWSAFCAGSEPPETERTPCGAFDVPVEALLCALNDREKAFDFREVLRTSGVSYTDGDGLRPVTSPRELLSWSPVLRRARAEDLEAGGVVIWDPDTLWAGPEVTVGEGTELLPNVYLRGRTTVGTACVLGPDTELTDCTLAGGVRVERSVLRTVRAESRALVGPWALLTGTELGADSSVGPGCVTSDTTLGPGASLIALNYAGESTLGRGARFEPGAVTADRDEERSWRANVGEEARVGANATLNAPVDLGPRSVASPGSTVSENVAEGAMAYTNARQATVKDYYRRLKK